jgi:hypothetical protein
VTSPMNDHPVRVEEALKLAAELRAPSWNKEDHDPKANYRTRPLALFERAAEMIERLAAPHPIEAQGSNAATDVEWLRAYAKVNSADHWPKNPEVRAWIEDHNRRVDAALSRPDPSLGGEPYTVQSFADLHTAIERFIAAQPDFPNYGDWPIALPAGHWRAINAARSEPSPPSLESEPEDRPHNPSKLQADAEALLQRLQDAWDFDASIGDASDMPADWCRAAEHRWKRTKRALEIIRSTDPAALSPPSLGMEGVREKLALIVRQELTDNLVETATLQHLGNPDVLLAGCKAVGYRNPEQAASEFAMFVVDAVIASISTPGEVG